MNREKKSRAFQDGRFIYQKSSMVQDALKFWKSLYYDLDQKFINDFTGLTDKNGNEIYEGDIMSCPFSHGVKNRKEKNYNCFVYWSDYNVGFVILIPKNLGSYRRIPTFQQCEVIGNIFQNPELIK